MEGACRGKARRQKSVSRAVWCCCRRRRSLGWAWTEARMCGDANGAVKSGLLVTHCGCCGLSAEGARAVLHSRVVTDPVEALAQINYIHEINRARSEEAVSTILRP
jgi:hypothetical protein